MNLQHRFGRNIGLCMLALGLSAGAAFALAPVQNEKPRKAVQKSPEEPKTDDTVADANLPSADQILDRYIEALGGEETLRKYSYRVTKGDFGIPSFGINGTFEVKQAAPHFFTLTLQIPNIGTSMHGYNGEVGWSKDDNTGPMILEGGMLEEMAREGDFYSDLNYKDHYPKRETKGKEEFAGVMCYRVHLASPSGTNYEAFYAVDTGLLTGLKGESETPQGKISTESTMEKYRAVDGVMVPHKMTVSYPELRMTQVMTVKEVSHEEFDKSAFDLPKEIQTLVEIQKEEADDADDDGDDADDVDDEDEKDEA